MKVQIYVTLAAALLFGGIGLMAQEEDDGAAAVDAKIAGVQKLTFKDGGLTGNPQWIWSGNTLMHMEWSWEATKMTTKGEHLFVEAGGFSEKNPVGWKPPLVVLKRATK